MKLKKKQQITAFEVCLYLFFGVLALLTLYPFYNVLIVSFSNTVTSVKYSPYLFPHVFDLTGYKAIIISITSRAVVTPPHPMTGILQALATW